MGISNRRLSTAFTPPPTIAGVGLVIRLRRWREAAFPIVFLATVSFIHAFHRPWWSYYYLHFAIPLAWLSAFAVGEAIAISGQLLASSHYRLVSTKTWQGVLICLLTAFILVRSEKRLDSNIKALRARPPVASEILVNKMGEYGSQTRWVYADQEIYPFHAGLSTPPELTVVVFKRFWSRQITTAELVATCKRYGTEQLVLNPTHITSDWNNFLEDYDAVYRDTNSVLYVAKRLTSHSKPSGKD